MHAKKGLTSGILLTIILVIIFIIIIGGLVIYSQATSRSSQSQKSVGMLEKIKDTFQSTSEEDVTSSPEEKIVDTNQNYCFNTSTAITCGSSFKGQDAQYSGNQPSYTDNGDGTITDNNTGLMWIKDAGSKLYYYDAKDSTSYAGYSDWRIPTIKELYSLIDFSGKNINNAASYADSPFIDDDVFVFKYGDTSSGDRIIDSQWITTNIYTSKVLNNQECFFGVNFADGRIKCYPTTDTGHNNGYYLRYVRGPVAYGENDFLDNENQTITDNSSGLVWQKNDSGKGLDWESALSYCENLSLAGVNDWRLPNAKELQYIVDYSRSPDATNSPAIDPIFASTSFTNLMDNKDWGYYWTGTTHENQRGAEEAVYISFGRGLGAMNGKLMDVHGAGCQRSDLKVGNENDYPSSNEAAPQGDVQRVYNYARCVRGGASPSSGENPSTYTGGTSQNGQSDLGGSQGTPPQEAISACNGKSSGVSCSFSTPKGIISGTCKNNPGGMACVPTKN